MAINSHLDAKDPRIGCLLISSPKGRSGKTTISLGLCAAFKRRGLSVQPFKKGPDYIDPSWLTAVAGRECRNLDLFLIPEKNFLISFYRACQRADIAIIEGAMGLYDGLDSPEYGTTAEIARLLNIPVILVVNTTRMTGSIAAMVSGYQNFQPDINIAGVILNNVSGSRHEDKLKNSVERYCRIPVVGSIPRDLEFNISERHLGLISSLESEESELIVERIGRKLESHLDLDHMLKIALSYNSPHPSSLPSGEDRMSGSQAVKAKIGVIFDRVFNFYYPENFEALKEAGAELLTINSLKDRLPPIDGLYIGGGFPEFFLEELEANRALRQDIAEAVEDGLPVYAECAGLMYLCRKIHWQGQSYEMVGVIPAEVQVSEKPEGHGYVIAEIIDENPLFPIGLTIRGHEFHHSKVSIKNDVKFAYQIRRGHGIDGKRDGILYKNMFAAYTHLHSLGTPCWAEAFVSLAAREGKFERR
jgi:cobyrinic acid a,c-diamide synthase